MSFISRAVRALVPRDQRERVEQVRFSDAGHGYDRLGMSREGIVTSLATSRPFYEWWFRVDSRGAENIPGEGPVILAPNHSGTLPIDGMMLWVDVVRRSDPPRVPRVVADTFVPRLPFVFTVFSRNGVIGGDRATVEHVLGQGEIVVVFAEGVPGIAKPRSEAYQLREFRVGHAELAIRFEAPIVPVAIVGAEEQWPELVRIESFHLFGAPYLPIPATPFPLPVKYRIRYGAPIDPRERFTPEQADDPAIVRALANEVQARVQALVDETLKERKGIFA